MGTPIHFSDRSYTKFSLIKIVHLPVSMNKLSVYMGNIVFQFEVVIVLANICKFYDRMRALFSDSEITEV